MQTTTSLPGSNRSLGGRRSTSSPQGVFTAYSMKSPLKTARVSYWDPNAISNMDGKKGAWVPCEGGKWYTIDDPASFGPAHTQPNCFGK